MEKLHHFCRTSPADAAISQTPPHKRKQSPLTTLRTATAQRQDSSRSQYTVPVAPSPTTRPVSVQPSPSETTSPMATISSRRTTPAQRPVSTVARALEAEETLEAEDREGKRTHQEEEDSSPDNSTDSAQAASSSGSQGEPSSSSGVESDQGLSTIEERTEVSEQAWSRRGSLGPTGHAGSTPAATPGAQTSSRLSSTAPVPVAEETEAESSGYATVPDTSVPSSSSRRPSQELS